MSTVGWGVVAPVLAMVSGTARHELAPGPAPARHFYIDQVELVE